MSFLTSSQTFYFTRKPHPKEQVCGDDGAVWDDADNTWLVISDGLGHGEGAAEASEAALSWITSNHSQYIETTIKGCDRAIRHTRGVSLNIAKIDRTNHEVSYASIGANLGWKYSKAIPAEEWGAWLESALLLAQTTNNFARVIPGESTRQLRFTA